MIAWKKKNLLHKQLNLSDKLSIIENFNLQIHVDYNFELFSKNETKLVIDYSFDLFEGIKAKFGTL